MDLNRLNGVDSDNSLQKELKSIKEQIENMDDHINELIDAKLEEIANGTY